MRVESLSKVSLLNERGIVLREVHGNIASQLPGELIDLQIDLSTGRITNWVAPTRSQIFKFIKGDI